jgi:hypothetical protein
MVNLFVANGGDAHPKNNYGRSPMDMAKQYGIADLIAVLGGE